MPQLLSATQMLALQRATPGLVRKPGRGWQSLDTSVDADDLITHTTVRSLVARGLVSIDADGRTAHRVSL